MGLFSGLFGKKKPRIYSGKNPPKGFIDAAKFGKTKGGFAGGYGAWTFGNIIDAHSSPEDIVEEFGLDEDNCPYGNCYERAYRECWQNAALEAIGLVAFGNAIEPDELIDFGEVQELAYTYAVQLAEAYIAGDVWIPREIIDWAYYDVSDHNR